MLKTVLDVTIPVLVFLLMLIVGLELTAEALRQVARRFRSVALATVAQVLVWPLVAVALLATFRLQPYIKAGLLLVAVCPSPKLGDAF